MNAALLEVNARKRAYLAAMGVPFWVPRDVVCTSTVSAPGSSEKTTVEEVHTRASEARDLSSILTPEPVALEPVEATQPASKKSGKGRAAALLAELNASAPLPKAVAQAQREAPVTPAPKPIQSVVAPVAPRVRRDGDYPQLHWLDPESLVQQVAEQKLRCFDGQGAYYLGQTGNGLCVIVESLASGLALSEDEACMALLGKMLQAIGQQIDRTLLAELADNHKSENVSAVSVKDLLHELQPRALLVMARIDQQYPNQSINHLRQQWMQIPTTAVPMVVSHHPSYLLQNPAAKRQSWDDLKHLRAFLTE